MNAAGFFRGDPLARRLFSIIEAAVASLGAYTSKVGKSQIAFRRKRNFAIVWRPAQYLRSPVAPLVLSITAPRRFRSRRWKEVVEPVPGRFTHHLEVFTAADIDAEVLGWIRAARELAS